MGANNWSECHCCRSFSETEQEGAMARLESQYGKIPVEEYKRELQKLSAPREPLKPTRREDWEVHLDESGYLTINFSSSCTKCLWNRQFRHEGQL
jgi:hypothetical protein